MNNIIGVTSKFASNSMVIASAAEPRIIGFDLQLILQMALHIISVLLLFFILGRLLFNPVRELMKKRKEEIANEYDNIESNKENALAMKKEYEEKLANIKQEADQILAKARKKALTRENEIINEAKDEAKKIIERANNEIAREKDNAKDVIKKEIIEVATIMAGKFVASSIDETTRNNLFEETLNEMGDQTWLN